MQRTLPVRAIDEAFVSHVGRLFDQFCHGIENEANMPNASVQATISAREKFESSFRFARITHAEMIDHLDKIKDNEL